MMIGGFSTQLMYDKINTLADKPEEVIVKMKTHETRLQKDDNAEVAVLISKLQTKNGKKNSTHSQKSQQSCGSGSQSDGCSLESVKHHCRYWKDTQECYRCHHVRQIARYCPSTAAVESRAPTETGAAAAAAATTMMTTSIENYWMTVSGRSPEKSFGH
jgi:hypothetical protein